MERTSNTLMTDSMRGAAIGNTENYMKARIAIQQAESEDISMFESVSEIVNQQRMKRQTRESLQIQVQPVQEDPKMLTTTTKKSSNGSLTSGGGDAGSSKAGGSMDVTLDNSITNASAVITSMLESISSTSAAIGCPSVVGDKKILSITSPATPGSQPPPIEPIYLAMSSITSSVLSDVAISSVATFKSPENAAAVRVRLLSNEEKMLLLPKEDVSSNGGGIDSKESSGSSMAGSTSQQAVLAQASSVSLPCTVCIAGMFLTVEQLMHEEDPLILPIPLFSHTENQKAIPLCDIRNVFLHYDEHRSTHMMILTFKSSPIGSLVSPNSPPSEMESPMEKLRIARRQRRQPVVFESSMNSYIHLFDTYQALLRALHKCGNNATGRNDNNGRDRKGSECSTLSMGNSLNSPMRPLASCLKKKRSGEAKTKWT